MKRKPKGFDHFHAPSPVFPASGGQMLHGAFFEKTAPLDPRQKLFIKGCFNRHLSSVLCSPSSVIRRDFITGEPVTISTGEEM